MSASLVGSEMCIRDRRRRGCRDAGTHCVAHCCMPVWGSEGVPPEAGSWGCLLYTSDAADDM
eukprot:8620695-Alexandrium_andersonii.AAC.1